MISWLFKIIRLLLIICRSYERNPVVYINWYCDCVYLFSLFGRCQSICILCKPVYGTSWILSCKWEESFNWWNFSLVGGWILLFIKESKLCQTWGNFIVFTYWPGFVICHLGINYYSFCRRKVELICKSTAVDILIFIHLFV